MLNGAGKISAFAWAGQMQQDEAPELMSILNSSKDIIIKFHAFESCLCATLCKNLFVIFTLALDHSKTSLST